ncbi:MAG: periplasmic heavy metal sensor [Acidobacteria bacterium]|nr:periplasmic heavy metal sensor [Acidobacteriota bacterium]
MITGFLLLGMLAGPMGGGGSTATGTGWWRDERMIADLNLAPEQAQRIERMFFEHRKSTIDLRAEMEKNQIDLESLMAATQLDEARISSQVDSVDAARARLHKAEVMMTIGIRKILTPEQWRKVESRRPGGPGGAAGMRPPMGMQQRPGGRMGMRPPGGSPPQQQQRPPAWRPWERSGQAPGRPGGSEPED